MFVRSAIVTLNLFIAFSALANESGAIQTNAEFIEQRDHGKGDDPSTTDGEGHGEACHDPGKQCKENDDQANLDPIKSEEHLLVVPFLAP